MMTPVLSALSRAGGPGAVLAPTLDVLRSMGPRNGLRHWRYRAAAVDPRLDRALEAVYRRIWADAAAAVDADLEQIDGGFLALRRGSSRTIVWRHLVMLDNQVTQRLSLDKPIVQRLLSQAGLPVPESQTFAAADIRPAQAFQGRHAGTACVVKPAGSASGTGVTCGMEGPDDLARAVVRAARWDKRLLIEQQARGDEYRVLVLDGELVGIVQRRAPRLRGDGRSTVGDLIAAENTRRLGRERSPGTRLIRVDLDCLLTLQRAGLSLRSVLSDGTFVTVKTSVSEGGPEDNHTISHVPEPLAADARRAADAVGLRLAGIDLVTSDLSRSLSQSGGVILEVNNPPGLHFHYLVSDPARVTPVAVPILSALLANDR